MLELLLFIILYCFAIGGCCGLSSIDLFIVKVALFAPLM